MVVALITDFGIKDYFVGAVKGTILSVDPNAVIVDISNEVPPQDIAAASFLLRSCYRDFPAGTVFLAVVDPGVGSQRKAIAVNAGPYFFVAPDNGILEGVLADVEEFAAVEITNADLLPKKRSSTFHGRDVFAPAAGHLSRGCELTLLGCETTLTRADENDVIATGNRGGSAARVIHIDRFGNVVTSIRNGEMRPGSGIVLGGRRISAKHDFFAQAEPGEVFLIEGSAGFIEIAARNGSAGRELGLAVGDELMLDDGS
jgi:S-adenosylmethionine hydrolase